MEQTKKDAMWIACCGCGKPIHLPETTVLTESDRFGITYRSTCPYCGFSHKVVVMGWP